MPKKYFLTTIFLIFSPLMLAMNRDMQFHSIVSLDNDKVAIAHKNGCIIFDQTSGKQLQLIGAGGSTGIFFDITASKNLTTLTSKDASNKTNHAWLFLSHDWQAPIIYDVNSNTSDNFSNDNSSVRNTYITINPMNNRLFSYDGYKLLCYDVAHKNLLSRLDFYRCTNSSIAHHPIKDELILKSSDEELSIIKSEPTPHIKMILSTNFKCDSTDYACDNGTIIMGNKQVDQSNYFICNLDKIGCMLPAYQLIADNCDYVASKFHLVDSIVALLSSNCRVHFFDFMTRTLIAKTKCLCSKFIFDIFPHKRLDFSSDGKDLMIALPNMWEIIKTPQNNLCLIYNSLKYLSLPKELIRHIIMNIIDSYKQTYEYIDFKTLLQIKPVIQARCEAENSNHENNYLEQKPPTKNIVAFYEREVQPLVSDFDGPNGPRCLSPFSLAYFPPN